MSGFKESIKGNTTMRAVVEESLGEEVVAVAPLSQGTPPSLASMMTGAALVKLFSPRASKSLPKRFILAVTPSRVVAIKGTPISDEDGNDTGAVVRGEIASWPRGAIGAAPAHPGEEGKGGGTLLIDGESIPVFDRTLGHPRERELFDALAG